MCSSDLAGRAPLVEALRRHPLYRALRLDRLVLAGLEATLRGYLLGELPPAIARVRAPANELRTRAKTLAEALKSRGVPADVLPDEGMTGGGSLPGEGLPGFVVALGGPDPDGVASRLRAGDPPVIVRVGDGRVKLDPRTVFEEEEEALIGAVIAAVRPTGSG